MNRLLSARAYIPLEEYDDLQITVIPFRRNFVNEENSNSVVSMEGNQGQYQLLFNDPSEEYMQGSEAKPRLSIWIWIEQIEKRKGDLLIN